MSPRKGAAGGAGNERWLPDALGNLHLVRGEGTKISEHEVTRVHLAACGSAIAERVGTTTCPECLQRQRTGGGAS